MNKLQFTPIVNGVIMTPEVIKQIELDERNARAMEYINMKAYERRVRIRNIADGICWALTIVCTITLTGLMFWR